MESSGPGRPSRRVRRFHRLLQPGHEWVRRASGALLLLLSLVVAAIVISTSGAREAEGETEFVRPEPLAPIAAEPTVFEGRLVDAFRGSVPVGEARVQYVTVEYSELLNVKLAAGEDLKLVILSPDGRVIAYGVRDAAVLICAGRHALVVIGRSYASYSLYVWY